MTRAQIFAVSLHRPERRTGGWGWCCKTHRHVKLRRGGSSVTLSRGVPHVHATLFQFSLGEPTPQSNRQPKCMTLADWTGGFYFNFNLGGVGVRYTLVISLYVSLADIHCRNLPPRSVQCSLSVTSLREPSLVAMATRTLDKVHSILCS